MSRIVIVGGHGKIALVLTRLLADRGDQVVGIVRNPDHSDDIASAGGRAEVFDLEAGSVADLSALLTGADAVVFAAGAGPGSSAERKRTVDLGAAVLTARAAELAEVPRVVQISAIGVDDPAAASTGDPIWRAYVEAKRDADLHLRGTDLGWTILRPGRLTDDPPTGLIALGADLVPAAVTRSDVAATVVAVLDVPEAVRVVWDLTGGPDRVVDAVRHAVGPSRR